MPDYQPVKRLFHIHRANQTVEVIPWHIAEEAYKEYAMRYSESITQSLERLAERGGLGAMEIITLLHDRCKRLERNIWPPD